MRELIGMMMTSCHITVRNWRNNGVRNISYQELDWLKIGLLISKILETTMKYSNATYANNY